MIEDFVDEFRRYRLIGEKALAQVTDGGLNRVFGAENNSVAVIVRHIGGNLSSRFTDFLTADGEKPWRDRDAEFEDREYGREEVERIWADGWRVLEDALAGLDESDLDGRVVIRGQSFTVHEALARSLAHISYHVGQIVTLARILSDGGWKWISIPKGKSAEYNQNPTMEKRPQ